MTMALSLSIRAVVVRRTGETSALTTTPPGTPKENPMPKMIFVSLPVTDFWMDPAPISPSDLQS